MPQGDPASHKYRYWERAHLALKAHMPQALSGETLCKLCFPPQVLVFCEGQIFDDLNSHLQEVFFVRGCCEERGCIFPGHHGLELKTASFLQ